MQYLRRLRLEQQSKPWWQEGEQPDYRFSLANERTFLAWIRTSLALLASAIGIDQLVLHYGLAHKWTLLAFSLALVATVTAISSWWRWRDNEIAMRHSRALRISKLMPMVAVYLFVISLLIFVYLL